MDNNKFNIGIITHRKNSMRKIRFESFENVNTVLYEKKQQMVDNGFFYNQEDEIIQCFCCYSIYPKHNDDCAFIKEKEQEQENITSNIVIWKYNRVKSSYLFEKERKKTFIEWPIPDIISPSDLAKNGFYYTRFKDIVKCIYCGTAIGYWKLGYDIKKIHEQKNNQCPFLNNKAVGNVPLTHSKIADKLFKPPLKYNEIFNTKHEYSYPLSVSQEIGKEVNLTVIKENGESDLDHRDRVNTRFDERLNTFKDMYWPDRVGIPPEEFAAAGFYCINCTDHVKCSYCGIMIRNWSYMEEKKNLPTIVHKILNPNCFFVRLKLLNKNSNYCYDKFYDDDNNINLYPSSKFFNNDNISDNYLNSLLHKSDLFTFILKNYSYPIELLKYILRKKIKKTGSPFYKDKKSIIQELQEFESQNQLFQFYNKCIIDDIYEFPTNDNDDDDDDDDDNICLTCCTESVQILLPCKHFIICINCTLLLTNNKCPMCRQIFFKTEVIPIHKEKQCIYCNRKRDIYCFLPCRHANVCKFCAVKKTKDKFPLICPYSECKKESYCNFQIGV